MTHRVALVSSSYDPYTGGVEEHVRSVARHLGARGHRVTVWTVDRGEHLGSRWVDGVEVHYLPTPLPSRSVAGILRFLVALPVAARAWYRAFQTFRPEVLHVQCFGPNGLYAYVLSRVTRTPLIISAHGEAIADDHSVYDRSVLLRAGLVRALRAASTVTGCSQAVLDDLAERFGSIGGLVVPNGIDLADDASARAPIEPPMVLAVGRVERVKGFDLLIEAFADADLPFGTRLVIGGEGGALSALEGQAQRLGLGEVIDFPGRLIRSQVADHMSKASAVVVPSRWEAFGIVVLEAWRAGAPVIVTSRGGPAVLVTNLKNGLVVDPEDTAALARALTSVLHERATAEALAADGLRTVEEFTWSRTVALYESEYHRCRPSGI